MYLGLNGVFLWKFFYFNTEYATQWGQIPGFFGVPLFRKSQLLGIVFNNNLHQFVQNFSENSMNQTQFPSCSFKKNAKNRRGVAKNRAFLCVFYISF